MKEIIDLRVSPEIAFDDEKLKAKIIGLLDESKPKYSSHRLIRRSIDARKKNVIYNLRFEVLLDENPSKKESIITSFKNVSKSKEIIIVGAGPAGYFAALECLKNDLKPIVLERGKSVRDRRKDLKAIMTEGRVDIDSNYCFGEGGAGTFSDGKLYTRAKKRGAVNDVLEIMVEHGAPNEIMIDAHPHIGSNVLPKMIGNIRKTIISNGGKILFGHKVTDLLIKNGDIIGVEVNGDTKMMSDRVILAIGHSARDIYNVLKKNNIKVERKDFALGVRVEHSQKLIDSIQYHCDIRSEYLPAASYNLAAQVDKKGNSTGVFSFCMCPGGFIIPAATAPGEIVINGMSLSRRDSPYANSGVVTQVDDKLLEDFKEFGEFAGIEFQKSVEKTMFKAGDGSLKAPAQRLVDFIDGKISENLPETSYKPGVFSAPLHDLLPKDIYKAIRLGFIQFGKKMKGYLTNEAIVLATESRTSSPLRIPRDRTTFEHTVIKGLFPCGEGAGFAGGIMSAAIDGQNIIKAIVKKD